MFSSPLLPEINKDKGASCGDSQKTPLPSCGALYSGEIRLSILFAGKFLKLADFLKYSDNLADKH